MYKDYIPIHSLDPFNCSPFGQIHSAPLGVCIHSNWQPPEFTEHSSLSEISTKFI